jgi:hypothetical protein
MLDVIAPLGTTDIQDATSAAGQTYKVAIGADGVPRAKIPPGLFRLLTADARNGGAWAALNSELIAQLAVAA